MAHHAPVHRLLLLGMAMAFAPVGGCNDSPTAPGPPVEIGATVTITASGVDPMEARIQPGQAVQFVNNDSRAREMASDPHPLHTDCPEINQVGVLNPGASRATGALQTVRVCGYHDHLTDDIDPRFRGRIIVGSS
jgi:plastocyanin